MKIEDLEEVRILSDNDGHDFLIPSNKVKEFNEAVKRFESGDDTLDDEWINDYMVGGCLSQLVLFTFKKDIK